MTRRQVLAGFVTVTALALFFSLPWIHPPNGVDKALHILIFFAYTFLFLVGHEAFCGRPASLSRLALLFLALALFGALFEEFQTVFVPSRSGDAADWFADLGGILLAMLYYRKRLNSGHKRL